VCHLRAGDPEPAGLALLLDTCAACAGEGGDSDDWPDSPQKGPGVVAPLPAAAEARPAAAAAAAAPAPAPPLALPTKLALPPAAVPALLAPARLPVPMTARPACAPAPAAAAAAAAADEGGGGAAPAVPRLFIFEDGAWEKMVDYSHDDLEDGDDVMYLLVADQGAKGYAWTADELNGVADLADDAEVLALARGADAAELFGGAVPAALVRERRGEETSAFMEAFESGF